MIVLMYISGLPGFGWGKPVPFNPSAVRLGRFGGALVSAAGPLANVVTAFLFALALRIFMLTIGAPTDLWQAILAQVFLSVIGVNVGLAVFNLLPIPPLDGFGVLSGVLPARLSRPLDFLAQYGFGILLILFVIRYQFGPNWDILGRLMRPASQWLYTLIAQVIGL